MTQPNDPQADTSSGDGEDDETRLRVSKAAVAFFKRNAGSRWKSLVEMPHNNPGFDIKALAQDGTEDLIEVKGQTGEWSRSGVIVTPTELAKAREMGSRYWLCVVEFALEPRRTKMYLVRNPYGLATEFRFDAGWKNVVVE